MSKVEIASTGQAVVFGPSSPGERRQRGRLALSLPVHVQPLSPEQKQLEEVSKTLNFNRKGLYFATALNHYYVGMGLVVTIPYFSVAARRRKYLGEVVRVEHLADGRQGVVVAFLSPGGGRL